MTWNIWPEFVALTISVIILIYSREYNMIPTLKNRVFRLCLFVVVFSIAVSIISVWAIEAYALIPLPLNYAIQTIYFIFTPLISVMFLMYIITYIRGENEKTRKLLLLISVPYLLYTLPVLANPWTHWIYDLSEPRGYTNGEGILLVYALVYLYLAAVLGVILFNRRRIEKSLQWVLLSFPVISLLMVMLQQVYDTVILSGTGAVSALLIVYLYLQNKQISVDDLTGLQNRKAFSKILELDLKRHSSVTVILISLDDFKVFNDKFGQANGDFFLKAISQFLATVLPLKCIYRYTGDEFAVIMKDSDRRDEAAVIEAIQRRFGEPWSGNHLTSKLTASLASVRIPEHGETLEEAIGILEYCISLSKSSGKGKAVHADTEKVSRAQRKHQIAGAIRGALAKGSFSVYFQPVYAISTNRFISAEALLRWDDAELGQVSPAEFIPIAEETGVIHEIFYFVLDQACKFIRQTENRSMPLEAVSINCSVLQFFQENLVENILKIIRENGVPPHHIGLEITESVFVEKTDDASQIMNALHDQGISFYLDDFGTGYSNLYTVVKLPFEYIKIDKSLLYEAENNEKSLSVMKALCATFSDNGMKVVIEGVERPIHREIVAMIQADFIQGYLYAMPMSGEEALACCERGSIPSTEPLRCPIPS